MTQHTTDVRITRGTAHNRRAIMRDTAQNREREAGRRERLTVDNPDHPPRQNKDQNCGSLSARLRPDSFPECNVESPRHGHHKSVKYLSTRKLCQQQKRISSKTLSTSIKCQQQISQHENCQQQKRINSKTLSTSIKCQQQISQHENCQQQKNIHCTILSTTIKCKQQENNKNDQTSKQKKKKKKKKRKKGKTSKPIFKLPTESFKVYGKTLSTSKHMSTKTNV